MIKGIHKTAAAMVPRMRIQEVIANNIANAQTPGFKKDSIFLRYVKNEQTKANNTTTSWEVEMLDGVYTDYSQGFLESTGRDPDVAIEGPGFFVIETPEGEAYTRNGAFSISPDGILVNSDSQPVLSDTGPLYIDGDGFFQGLMPDGTPAYTRDGSLKLSGEGRIVTSDGFFMQPEITIPEDAVSIAIGFDGKVSVVQVGSNDPVEIGQIELARFVNPAGLMAIGHNLFQETPASGTPLTGAPTESGLGQIQQGYLELSNVDVVMEIVNMIVAQRAYEINSKVVQTADDMSSLMNNLKR